MKKLICIILSIVILFSLAGCSGARKTANVTIDYGESELYSQEDRETAANMILDKMKTWKGVNKVFNLRYAGDEASLEEKGYDGYDEIMIFYSDFKTVRSSSKAGGFNTNEYYTDWNFILGKNADGNWVLLTWGY